MPFVVLGISTLTLVLCAMEGMYHAVAVIAGYESMPRWCTRRYWRRVAVRVICRLAELEAAWERKIPRKVAASRGMVGQRIRRTEYIYIDIIPQTDPHVKGLRVRKVKRYE